MHTILLYKAIWTVTHSCHGALHVKVSNKIDYESSNAADMSTVLYQSLFTNTLVEHAYTKIHSKKRNMVFGFHFDSTIKHYEPIPICNCYVNFATNRRIFVLCWR